MLLLSAKKYSFDAAVLGQFLWEYIWRFSFNQLLLMNATELILIVSFNDTCTNSDTTFSSLSSSSFRLWLSFRTASNKYLTQDLLTVSGFRRLVIYSAIELCEVPLAPVTNISFFNISNFLWLFGNTNDSSVFTKVLRWFWRLVSVANNSSPLIFSKFI